ncbi:MAG: DUF488 domain-containing protein [Chloroflexota bacterium]
MYLFTIGFTKKDASTFFGLLKTNGVRLVLDIRLHPGGQLSGFAKGQDLAYFLPLLSACEYRHEPLLAPTEEIMAEFKSGKQWGKYVDAYERLLDERRAPEVLDANEFLAGGVCLLCSEAKPDRCHRRLSAERIVRRWPQLEIVHLI